jgi:integrase
MIDFEAGCIRTPSKKGRTLTRKGRLLRAIPLQQQLLPWLELLKRMACPNGGEPDPMAFVLKTNARPTAPSRKTLGERFAMALTLAGQKQPKKQSHGFRATHATWGAAEHKILSTEQLKAFLGHANVWMGATDDYVDMMVGLLTPEHRTYIRHLPSPAQLEAAVAAFVPPALPPTPKRRRKLKPKA